MSKRVLFLALAATVAFLVMAPATAFANYAIHGGYTEDTDACAGCHRAHSSASSLQWQDSANNNHSALLISTADAMYKFCYACHDAASQGAETDVQYGRYEGSAHGSQDTTLNGGGFEGIGNTIGGVTSDHMYTGAYWGAYGGGAYGNSNPASATGEPAIYGVVRPNAQIANVGESDEKIKMDCVSCHDPHGSSNYRILKDQVYGNTVGGYTTEGTPTPFVVSAERGYPTTETVGYNGFKKQVNYDSTYFPNYTTPQYAKAPNADPAKGMSGWCIGCHVTYLTKSSVYNAGDGVEKLDENGNLVSGAFTTRHRHPMNVPLSNFKNGAPGEIKVTSTQLIPLAHDTTEDSATVNALSDWIECLSCHYAHGSSADMTGFANVDNVNAPVPNSGTSSVVVNGVTIVKKGVAPTGDSALLRMNNRGVCQACHDQ